MTTSEVEFEQSLRAYITGYGGTRFYGLVNLLTTIAEICDQLTEDGGTHYDTAATALYEVAEELDLPYRDPEDNV